MRMNVSFLVLLTTIVLTDAAKATKELDLNFQQHDYNLTFERLELVRYNKDYVKEMSMVTFKYNRTQPVVNSTFSFGVDLGNDLMGILQAYKFVSNEYRLFPLRFEASFCKAIAANMAGCRRLVTGGNFTGCPLVKGKRYHIFNFYPDQEKFPPFIPNGNYKVEVQTMYFSKEVFVVNMYASISRPIKWHD